ncbi:hypothetical protein BD413DRAFT_610328 [Trametes elegans]|nr:hypothetical protein BD413DRAFT_610328 [Trametes elegans]
MSTSSPEGLVYHNRVSLELSYTEVTHIWHYIRAFPNLQVFDMFDCDAPRLLERTRAANVLDQGSLGSWPSFRLCESSSLAALYALGIQCHIRSLKIQDLDECLETYMELRFLALAVAIRLTEDPSTIVQDLDILLSVTDDLAIDEETGKRVYTPTEEALETWDLEASARRLRAVRPSLRSVHVALWGHRGRPTRSVQLGPRYAPDSQDTDVEEMDSDCSYGADTNNSEDDCED